MADYIEGLLIGGVQKKIDYEGLANKPEIPDISGKQDTLTDTDGSYGQRVKAIEDALAAAIDFESQTY